MKMKLTGLVVVMLFCTLSVFAANKTEKFKVYGNCGMCEDRIENAVTAIKGVSKAEWNQKTEMIEVVFDDKKVSLEDIHKAIAKVGHDTDLQKAKDDVYSELHGCCKYDRPEKK